MNLNPGDLRHFRQQWQLADGTPVVIRAVRHDDRDRIVRAFHELEPESVYTRLFSYRKELTESDLDRLAEVDFVNAVVLVVEKGDGAGGVILIGGVSYYIRDADDGARVAEIAFTIEEDYQGLGLASKLLALATDLARAQGVARFEAEVLAVNASMLGVFRHSGLPLTEHSSEGEIHVVMDLAVPDAAGRA